MAIYEFAVALLFYVWIVTRIIPALVQRHRRKLAARPKGPVELSLYDKIARAEIDIYGHTFDNADSPWEGGITSLYEMPPIDDTGHYWDHGRRRCNRNASLGPACGDVIHDNVYGFTDEDGIP